VVYDVHTVGFWIRLADVRPLIMCVPVEVELWAHGWLVTADCGADDNSTPVYRMGFTFEFEADADKVTIGRWKP
jgi:hypothetical protein